MTRHLIFLTVPGLRKKDLPHLPALSKIFETNSSIRLEHSFPSITWPAQATMLTGSLPNDHGVVANGFYWRDERRVEMWTASNKVIDRPQIWDVLKIRHENITSAAWFPMLSKGCGADYVCMPAPIHKPDGSEELWCYTKPQPFYGELISKLGHFPLQHFWGPIANIKSSQWIADSAVLAAKQFKPNFFYIYLPQLDYAAQKFGPDSPQAIASLQELNKLLDPFVDQIAEAYAGLLVDWLVASEYVIREVNHVSFPNRILRTAGLLVVDRREAGEQLDLAASQAWALVDHQFSHVFVRDADPTVIGQVQRLFASEPGIAATYTGTDRSSLGLDHARSGDVILVSQPNSWQAYYWWLDDSAAPSFARTVDIHRKPGYDPVELFFDPQTKSIPLRAELIHGSHGVIVPGEEQGMLLATWKIGKPILRDTEISELVLSHFR